MAKWADYLISEVSYDSDHLISIAIRHEDTERGISKGQPIDRLTIFSDIKNGLLYLTIYSGKDSWKKGQKIQTFSIDGNPYLRIDGNKVKLDHLGDLPESSIIPEPVKEIEFKTESIPEPSSPRGSLPKESTEELPQELDLAPEPVEESILEPTKEPEEEEATPEQISQLNDLQQQIDGLEEVLSKKLSSDEPTPEQLSRVEELEKEIAKLEKVDVEKEIIKPLQKQNKKLDKIEKKLRRSSKKTFSKTIILEAYCVKCKTKREIKNPKETTMKNGRPAVKGTCSVCNCKVFRIGKIKK